MRMKKDKEKVSQIPGHRHSSAASYEISTQGLMQEFPDEYILEQFEQMLVRKKK